MVPKLLPHCQCGNASNTVQSIVFKILDRGRIGIETAVLIANTQFAVVRVGVIARVLSKQHIGCIRPSFLGSVVQQPTDAGGIVSAGGGRESGQHSFD